MKTTSILILLAAAAIGSIEKAHGFDKTYSKTSGNSTLGAEFDAKASDNFTSSGYEFTASAKGTAKLLGKSFRVIDGSAEAGIDFDASKDTDGVVAGYTLTTKAHGDLVLKACGKVLTDIHRKTSTSASTTFAKSGSSELVSLDLPSKIKEVKFADATFMVGPIPITVSAGASVSIGADGGLTLVKKNGVPAMKASMGPTAEAALTASAGIDVVIASAGIEAKATLMKLAPKAYVVLSTSADFSTGTLEYGFDLNYQGVSGAINLYAEVDLWLWSDRWETTIARFGDTMHTTPIIKKDTLELWDFPALAAK